MSTNVKPNYVVPASSTDKFDCTGQHSQKQLCQLEVQTKLAMSADIATVDDVRSYLGAKGASGVYQAVINLMPPHQTYIEPFLGTGTIMLRKAPANINVGIDLSEQAIARFNRAAAQTDLNVKTFHCDAITWLESLNTADENTLIYLDPPYVLSTRTSRARYDHELTDEQHIKLLEIVKRIAQQQGAKVMISGYSNNIYNQTLADWFSKDFQAMTRGGVRTETVWCSFQPGELHYHTFAGDNYVERQRIKRKAERWAKRYQAMQKPERQAVMAALLSIVD